MSVGTREWRLLWDGLKGHPVHESRPVQARGDQGDRGDGTNVGVSLSGAPPAALDDDDFGGIGVVRRLK